MPTTARGIPSPNLTDTANGPRDFLAQATAVEAWLARPRSYASTVHVDNVATGATLATIVIPAQPLACRILICFNGAIGFGSAADFAVNVTASAGTLTATMAGGNVAVAAGKFGAFAYAELLTVAASTASTLTLKTFSTSGNSYIRGMFTADIKYASEYA